MDSRCSSWRIRHTITCRATQIPSTVCSVAPRPAGLYRTFRRSPAYRSPDVRLSPRPMRARSAFSSSISHMLAHLLRPPERILRRLDWLPAPAASNVFSRRTRTRLRSLRIRERCHDACTSELAAKRIGARLAKLRSASATRLARPRGNCGCRQIGGTAISMCCLCG